MGWISRVTKPGPPVGAVIEERKSSGCQLFSGRMARDFLFRVLQYCRSRRWLLGARKRRLRPFIYNLSSDVPEARRPGCPGSMILYTQAVRDVREPGWPGPLGSDLGSRELTG